MSNLFVGRVLSEDEDFVTIEVGKHDKVSWTIAPAPDEARRPPPRFLTLLFVRHPIGSAPGVARPWNPFAR